MHPKWILFLSLIFLLVACGGEDESSKPTQTPQAPVELRPQRPPDLPTSTVQQVLAADSVQLADGSTLQLLGIRLASENEAILQESLEFTRSLLEGKEIGLEIGVAPTNENGQAVAYVWVGELLGNYEIVRGGHAYRALSSAPSQHDGFISRAEGLAQAEQLGVWQSSPITLTIHYVMADPPGPDDENWDAEEVQIRNTGADPIELAGFTLRDNDTYTFTFPEGSRIQAGQTISVFSGCGVSTASIYYWCADGQVWNNAGDGIFLRDPQGATIDYREIAPPR